VQPSQTAAAKHPVSAVFYPTPEVSYWPVSNRPGSVR
jgi:hypothetical protein